MNFSYISLQVLRDLRHDNVNSFLGCVQRPSPSQGLAVLTDYAARGSLRQLFKSLRKYHTSFKRALFSISSSYNVRIDSRDILCHSDITLDDMFTSSLVMDILRGLIYLQESSRIGFHGNLKVSFYVVSKYAFKVRILN